MLTIYKNVAPAQLVGQMQDPSDTVVAYCHIGQQATGVVFAARLLGHKVALYDVSFEDWSRRGLPVEVSKPR